MLNSEYREKLPSIKDTITKTIAIYRGRFRDFASVMGFQSLINLLYYFWLTTINNYWVKLLESLLIFIISVVGIVVQIYLASDKKITMRQSLVKTKGKIIGSLWISFLIIIMAFGGAYLLLIPLVIFNVWFVFSRYIFLLESESGMNAILKSREYVRGYFWPIFVRLLFCVVFWIAFYVLPPLTFLRALPKYLWSLWNTFWIFFTTPVSVIYWLVIYRQIVSLKKLGEFKASNGKKALYLNFGFLSFMIFLLLVLTIIVIFAMAHVAKNPNPFVNNPL